MEPVWSLYKKQKKTHNQWVDQVNTKGQGSQFFRELKTDDRFIPRFQYKHETDGQRYNAYTESIMEILSIIDPPGLHEIVAPKEGKDDWGDDYQPKNCFFNFEIIWFNDVACKKEWNVWQEPGHKKGSFSISAIN